MKPLLILALTLLVPAAAKANDTQCSDASGHVKYVHTGYNRGIPPREGDVIGTIDVLIDGRLESESIAYQGKAAQLGPINPDFTEIKVLDEGSGSNGYHKDFSAKLTLSKNPEKTIAATSAKLPIEAYVICHESFLAVP